MCVCVWERNAAHYSCCLKLVHTLYRALYLSLLVIAQICSLTGNTRGREGEGDIMLIQVAHKGCATASAEPEIPGFRAYADTHTHAHTQIFYTCATGVPLIKTSKKKYFNTTSPNWPCKEPISPVDSPDNMNPTCFKCCCCCCGCCCLR